MGMISVELLMKYLWCTAESPHASGGDHVEAVDLLRGLMSRIPDADHERHGLSEERLRLADEWYLSCTTDVEGDQRLDLGCRSRDADRLRVLRRAAARRWPTP